MTDNITFTSEQKDDLIIWTWKLDEFRHIVRINAKDIVDAPAEIEWIAEQSKSSLRWRKRQADLEAIENEKALDRSL